MVCLLYTEAHRVRNSKDTVKYKEISNLKFLHRYGTLFKMCFMKTLQSILRARKSSQGFSIYSED